MLNLTCTCTATNLCNSFSNKQIHKTLRRLRSNSGIRICKYDKGRGTVILNADDYFKKLDSIILTNKFVEVTVPDNPIHHPTIKTEKSIQSYINRHIRTHISAETLSLISPVGSKPGSAYGLAKIHKKDVPLRPVISMVGTPQYGLAKYLNNIIKPTIPSNHMLSSTTDFIERLKAINLPSRHSLVSFDVQSLFTNVPLNEAIDLACRYVYDHNSPSKPSYDRKHFKKLLMYATSGEFLYNQKMYRQVDGVAMGSPLAPTLANLFMAHLEQTWVASRSAPFVYYRYVDDIFCVFDLDVSNHSEFLTFLNSQHANLKFTVEVGSTTLPFLDVHVDTSSGNSRFSVFRKETYTGLLLNFSAVCPMLWKRSLICCLLKRAFDICSDHTTFMKEVCTIRNIFVSNAYPVSFFHKVLQAFLMKLQNPGNANHIDNQDRYTIVLPYYGKASETLRPRLSRLCKRFGISCHIAFVPFKVARYFCLKSRLPDLIHSHVVYKYSCPVDPDHCYIGKTKRHLVTRIREHAQSNTQSAIFDHRLECDCIFLPAHFRILRVCNDDYSLNICEALHIKESNPSLNRTVVNNGQSCFLQLF